MVACVIPYIDLKGWKGEERCRLILQILTGHPFAKTRALKWLVNPSTGRRLELDCYNDELLLGLERNGEQHYHSGHFNNDLEYDVYKDRVKEKLCYLNGVTLIIVPYTIPKHRLVSYILSKLERIEDLQSQS